MHEISTHVNFNGVVVSVLLSACTILGGIVTWFLNRLVGTVDRNTEALQTLETKVATLSQTIEEFPRLERRIERLEAHPPNGNGRFPGHYPAEP